MTFDLTTLDTKSGADEGRFLQLRNPSDGSPLPVWLKCLGADGEKFRATRVANQRRSAMLRKSGRDDDADDPTRIESTSIQALAEMVVEWESESGPGVRKPGLCINGDVLQCTTDNVAQVLTDYLWIREQVAAFALNRANFIRATPNQATTGVAKSSNTQSATTV